jgi:hypothetical protein
MVKLNQLICHLENLLEVHGNGDVEVTIPTLDGDDILFLSIDRLSDVNVATFKGEDGVEKTVAYIDVDGLLEPEENQKPT